MPNANPLAALVRRINPGHADVPDAELLDRFVGSQDQAAFELLVWRHGAMVWGVCRRVLGPDRAAAEDACQAAFVALARHAPRLRHDVAVGAWLHRVAVRASIDLVRSASRLPASDHADPPARDADPLRHACDREVRSLLDTALNHLPDKFRVPFVLCELEGRTNAEAAAALGCPVGTVESRLTRARQRLRDWLTARGVVPAVATAAVALPESARSAMVRAADPAQPSAAVKALAARAIPSTLSAKVRALVAVCLVMAAGAAGLGMAVGEEPKHGKQPQEKKVRLDGPTRGPVGDGEVVGALVMEAAMFEGGRVGFLIQYDAPGPDKLAPPQRVVAAFAVEEARAFDTDGRPLTDTELAERLTEWTAVVVFPAELGLPDAVYRKVLNERSVIFLIPKAHMGKMIKAAGERRQGDAPPRDAPPPRDAAPLPPSRDDKGRRRKPKWDGPRP